MPHVWQRKQSRCHRWPAGELGISMGWLVRARGRMCDNDAGFAETYLIQKLCLLQESMGEGRVVSLESRLRGRSAA